MKEQDEARGGPEGPRETIEAIAGLAGAVLRPVRQSDRQAVEAFFARLSPEDMRMRFFAPLRTVPRATLARLMALDGDREMALALEIAPGEFAGIARLSPGEGLARAEFAVAVRSDLKRRGIGRLLVTRILDHARARGIGEVTGSILRENVAMVALARALGFAIEDEPGGARHRIELRRSRPVDAPGAEPYTAGLGELDELALGALGVGIAA
ncbi:MAG: GNAT family N-acetyltransferase, partial [Alphaproteobacteria bacterium]